MNPSPSFASTTTGSALSSTRVNVARIGSLGSRGFRPFRNETFPRIADLYFSFENFFSESFAIGGGALSSAGAEGERRIDPARTTETHPGALMALLVPRRRGVYR